MSALQAVSLHSTGADSRPADPGIAEWKARASLTALPGRLPQASMAKEEGPDVLDPLLCYACATTLNRRKAADMPPFVEAEAERRRPVSEGDMRAAISDFLLE